MNSSTTVVGVEAATRIFPRDGVEPETGEGNGLPQTCAPGGVPLAHRAPPSLGKRRTAAQRFEGSDPTVLRGGRAYRRTGRTQAKPGGGDHRSGRIEAHADFLLRTLEETPDLTRAEPEWPSCGCGVTETPDLTRAELQEILRHEPGEPFAPSTIYDCLRHHGIRDWGPPSRAPRPERSVPPSRPGRPRPRP